MQKIIIKDVLRVLQEKCFNLKNSFGDRSRLQNVNFFLFKILIFKLKIFFCISTKNFEEYNKKLEETISLMIEISYIILQGFFSPTYNYYYYKKNFNIIQKLSELHQCLMNELKKN